MFSIFLKLIFFTVLLIVSACHPQQNITPPPAPDYSQATYWYGQTEQVGKRPVDIFYVYPTLGNQPTDADGQPLLLSDITQQEQRQAALGNQRFNQEVYAATDYNFYAPFLQNIDDADMKEQLRRVAAADIAEAFDYYMTHFNQGRPFILLGHSQGSSVLLQLLKNHINNKDFNQMVAA